MRCLSTLLILILTAVSAMAARLVEKLPPVAEVVPGYASLTQVKERMNQAPLHSVEGIWQFPSTGAIVAVERDEARDKGGLAVRYRLVIVRSPQRTLRPGTVMGLLAPTSKKNVYAAEIYTGSDGGSRLRSPRSFTLTLSDDARLSFVQNSGLKVYTNLFRMIPYLSRVSFRIYRQQHSPRDLDGCLRLFPMPASGPLNPVYL